MVNKELPSTWDKVQGRIKEVAGRASGNSDMAQKGAQMQRAGDGEQESAAPADVTDPLEVDGEMGQGGGRQFDPDPLRRDSTPASQPGPDAITYDRDPGRPNSQEDRDVEHRSRRTEADPGYLDPEKGYSPE